MTAQWLVLPSCQGESFVKNKPVRICTRLHAHDTCEAYYPYEVALLALMVSRKRNYCTPRRLRLRLRLGSSRSCSSCDSSSSVSFSSMAGGQVPG